MPTIETQLTLNPHPNFDEELKNGFELFKMMRLRMSLSGRRESGGSVAGIVYREYLQNEVQAVQADDLRLAILQPFKSNALAGKFIEENRVWLMTVVDRRTADGGWMPKNGASKASKTELVFPARVSTAEYDIVDQVIDPEILAYSDWSAGQLITCIAQLAESVGKSIDLASITPIIKVFFSNYNSSSPDWKTQKNRNIEEILNGLFTTEEQRTIETYSPRSSGKIVKNICLRLKLEDGSVYRLFADMQRTHNAVTGERTEVLHPDGKKTKVQVLPGQMNQVTIEA